MLEPLLITLALILLIAGVAGSVLPVLPGPPLSWLGLLVLKFVASLNEHLSWSIIISVGAFVAGLISGSHIKAAFKHASGAFLGFFTGIVLKFINLGVIIYWIVKVLA